MGAHAQSAKDYFQKAVAYSNTGDGIKAIAFYGKAIEADPRYKAAYYNRALLEIEGQQIQAALDDLKKYELQDAPLDDEALYLIALCDYYLKDIKSSKDILDQYLLKKPASFDGLKLRGTIYYESQMYSEGIIDLEKALLLNSADPEIYYGLGFCYGQLKQPETSLKNYYKAEALGVKDAQLFNEIGHQLIQIKDDTNALIYFNKALDLDSKNGLYYYNKGIALNNIGFKQIAIDAWKKAKELGFKDFDPGILGIIE